MAFLFIHLIDKFLFKYIEFGKHSSDVECTLQLFQRSQEQRVE